MTNEEAKQYLFDMCSDCDDNDNGECVGATLCFVAKQTAIKALSQQTEDAISREQAKAEIRKAFPDLLDRIDINSILNELPSVTPKQSNRVLCKDCKYFEYDSVAKVDDIPLIVAHEICKRWGDGCKTDENGWCFLAEKREEQS